MYLLLGVGGAYCLAVVYCLNVVKIKKREECEGMAKVGLIGLVGKEAKQDFWGTMEKVAEIGYEGVEGVTALLEGDVQANLQRFHDLGLRVITYSASREDLEKNLDTIIKNAKLLEVPHVSVWWGPCESKEQLLEDAALYNRAGEALAKEGLKLCYHNHEHEFRASFNGVYAFDILVEYTNPEHLFFEIDVAWAAFGGQDPVELLHRLKGRVPAVHLKDLYALEKRGQFTAVGTGVVDIAAAVQAAQDIGVDWMVVEQDELRHLTAIETITVSYLNLKETGLLEK